MAARSAESAGRADSGVSVLSQRVGPKRELNNREGILGSRELHLSI
jgi:hypothetical protein